VIQLIVLSVVLALEIHACLPQNPSSNTNIVITPNGRIRGQIESFGTGRYYSYKGIRYGQAPTGPKRFKAASKEQPWNDTRDAISEGNLCPQIFLLLKTYIGNEDCLFLNVYTKEVTPRKPLPVMVWIHGGAFKMGDSSEMVYGPDYLLANDIVYVSLNYRLGVLGFMSFDDPSINVPGNAALKDQRLALKWVRENVHHFGGDSNNITVFGESAGGASVHWHMLSNFSKGLFDKAIVQSGSALLPWANAPRSNRAERLAKKLGWDGVGGDVKLLEFLRRVDVADLILAQDSKSKEEGQDWSMDWVPSMEPYAAEQSFFTYNSLEMYKSAWGNKIPLIIGGTTDEGLLFYRDTVSNPQSYKGDKVYENLIPRTWNLPIEKVKEFGQQLKNFYIGEDECGEDKLGRFFDIMSDTSFLHGMHLAIRGRLQDKLSAPTYLYRFAFAADPNFNMVRKVLIPNDVKGVCHGEDIASLFKPAFGKEPTINSAEHKTIDRMTRMFTRFAASGNPNCDLIRPVIWNPLENLSTPPFSCLNIDDELSYIIYPEAKRMALWDSFFDATSY